jgi:hypothetical protein
MFINRCFFIAQNSLYNRPLAWPLAGPEARPIRRSRAALDFRAETPYILDMAANTRHKDSVFSLLFSKPDILRELYSALSGVDVPPDTPVTINTLEDALFMDRINDISCAIADRLVIFLEHQSTINPNMAVRIFLYAARVYEKIIGDRSMYATKKLIIPRPRFFVLYNGAAPFPDTAVLRLRDSFAEASGFFPPGGETPALDLEVEVLNINEGRNRAVAERCRTLREYAAFVARVRDFRNEAGDIEEAIKKAVVYCRNHDILKEFLEQHATEVLNMLFGEWDMDTALAVRYEEGREEAAEKYEARLRQAEVRNRQVEARVRQEQARVRQEQELRRQEQARVRQLEEEIRRLRESAGNQRSSG